MKTKLVSIINAAAGVLALLSIVAVPAFADTITVTNTNDSGPGSLRNALAIANDGDTINFAVSGTIALTSGELVVDNNITISGPGSDNLAVDGNSKSRVFYVGPDATVIISDLTITNGTTPRGEAGGGIYNDHSTLTLNACDVSDNLADLGSGGGIFTYGGLGTVNNSTFTGNSAFFGGGIYIVADQSGNATLTVNTSTFIGNMGGFAGGGIYNYAISGSATVTLNNSTFNGNSAGTNGAGGGGGIYNDNGGTATVNNSTFSSNSSSIFAGGAIYNSNNLTLNNTTFNGDSADVAGSIYNDQALVNIGNTILNAGAGGNIFSNSGTITSLGYNLSSDDSRRLFDWSGRSD